MAQNYSFFFYLSLFERPFRIQKNGISPFELFIYLCLNAAKRNETKHKWFLEFPSTGVLVGSVF